MIKSHFQIYGLDVTVQELIQFVTRKEGRGLLDAGDNVNVLPMLALAPFVLKVSVARCYMC